MNFSQIQAKLEVLADAAKYDASCSSSGSKRKRLPDGLGNVEGMGICHSYAPDGRCISLLKILLTNFCIYDCKFCINRITSDVKRARFLPAEVVWLTLEFYRRNYIEGLFLSSGIFESIDATMEQLTEVARCLREDHRFQGYIHLKVVPGASQEMISEAGKWADRVSANMEMPTQNDLDLLAPAKKIASVADSMGRIGDGVREANENRRKSKKAPIFAPAGQTTQMVVGATQSSDALILNISERMYKKFELRRVYYSAYSPIPDAHAVLPVRSPPLERENRLYQADWLIRFYGFHANEIANESSPDLSLDIDPKSAWALRNRGFFPVDVNAAPREALLRIPGIGVRNVDRILALRRFHQIRLLDLQKMRVAIGRARYFVTTADHNPNILCLDQLHLGKKISPKTEQLSLFDGGQMRLTGEL